MIISCFLGILTQVPHNEPWTDNVDSTINMLLLLGLFELWTQYPGSVVPLAMFAVYFFKGETGETGDSSGDSSGERGLDYEG